MHNTTEYTWHQSHDQATVLLVVPSAATEADIHVEIEGNYIVAGLHGQPPIIKGRLYGPVDSAASMWQLEPLARSRLSARERTNSTTSTASSQHSGSSFAFVSDPEVSISSSFAASLDVSDAEDASSSPANVSSGDEGSRRGQSHPVSRSASPGRALQSLTASSFSSLESLHSNSRRSRSGRLLTLHLEKRGSSIWPSLIVGPAPDSLSPSIANSVVFDASEEMEHQYNMDATSLLLIALEMLDIRRDKEEAFEFLLRAWHQSHSPTATMKLVTHYVSLNATSSLALDEKLPRRGSTLYYAHCLGGDAGLAQLYLEAGLLHVEGAAAGLLTSSASSLASLRVPHATHPNESSTEVWKRDREAAAQYFDRARLLNSSLDIPVLPPSSGMLSREPSEQLEMPSIDLKSFYSEPGRKRKSETTLFGSRDSKLAEELDNAWYLYVPGLVGAGTALLVVGVISALSLSSWSRRNQGS